MIGLSFNNRYTSGLSASKAHIFRLLKCDSSGRELCALFEVLTSCLTLAAPPFLLLNILSLKIYPLSHWYHLGYLCIGLLEAHFTQK